MEKEQISPSTIAPCNSLAQDGILVPQNDVPTMVSAIEELLQDPEKCQQIAKAAYEKVRKFDWEIVKEEWINVLNE